MRPEGLGKFKNSPHRVVYNSAYKCVYEPISLHGSQNKFAHNAANTKGIVLCQFVFSHTQLKARSTP
jgi:hypothetical protein